jgi:hypothetical protein
VPAIVNTEKVNKNVHTPQGCGSSKREVEEKVPGIFPELLALFSRRGISRE